MALNRFRNLFNFCSNFARLTPHGAVISNFEAISSPSCTFDASVNGDERQPIGHLHNSFNISQTFGGSLLCDAVTGSYVTDEKARRTRFITPEMAWSLDVTGDGWR